MDLPLIMIMATAALSLLALVVTLLGHQRGRGPRHLVMGLGWVLVPIGLWVVGLMDLIGEGGLAAYRWLMRTQMDLQHWIGVAVGTLGVLLIVVAALFVKPRTREQARLARQARRPGVAARPGSAAPGTVGGGSAGSSDPAGRTSAPAAKRAAAAAPATKPTDEDDEIEAILKRRGIN